MNESGTKVDHRFFDKPVSKMTASVPESEIMYRRNSMAGVSGHEHEAVVPVSVFRKHLKK
jgi:hypothetical protein